MAAPGHGLRTHNCNPFLAAQANERFELILKSLRLHVVGVAPKTLVAPARVGGVFAWLSQTAQGLQMNIFNALRAEAVGQRCALELRIAARARYGADINEPLYAIGFQGPCMSYGRAILTYHFQDH